MSALTKEDLSAPLQEIIKLAQQALARLPEERALAQRDTYAARLYRQGFCDGTEETLRHVLAPLKALAERADT